MKRTDITDVFPEATAEQIDKLIGIHGADINRAKEGLEELKTQLSTAQQEIQTLKTAPPDDGRVSALQQELDALKAANALRDMRAKVAGEKKIPANLLTGDTEEACMAQADAILEYARPKTYPQLRDGGEATNINIKTTREKFAEWAKESL